MVTLHLMHAFITWHMHGL